jgi:HEPN domain-containing protein
MSNTSDQPPPSDVCLLLRAHAEARWLTHEVAPVLRELEQRELLPEEQLGAALAYLEVLWIESRQRAAETDATYAQLDATAVNGDRALNAMARGYHAAVRRLRDSVGSRVTQRLTPAGDASPR